MQLKAEPEMAGKVVRCPGCNTKLSIPANLGGLPPPTSLPPPPSGVNPPDGAHSTEHSGGESSEVPQYQNYTTSNQQERGGWEEADPANPSVVAAIGIGLVTTLAWYGILFPFGVGAYGTAPTNSMDYIHDLFYERTWVNMLETFFFFWAMAILWLKHKKLRHQKDAMYLDVLPSDISQEINSGNVGQFIDHLYGLPARLRDSMMVNRIRKALELFEVKQNAGDVSHMLSSQSEIDGMRISGSYTLTKAFLWAIPLLGFIGTVIGLSHAIGGMNFSDMDDLKQVKSTLQNVTGGLGTAFDATLLGLVLATLLNFPMNALAKAEDDNLNTIDAFCNEVLLPRLNDGGGIAGGDTNGLMDTLVKAVANSQKEFLTDLNALSKQIKEQADNLDKRAAAHQQRVDAEFATALNRMRDDLTNAVKDSVKTTTDYTRALASGIQSLNTLLSELGGKQIMIHQVKKKGWFSRD
jgi:flagellar motor component MotA